MISKLVPSTVRRRLIDGSRPARRLVARLEVGWARRRGWTPISRMVGADVVVIETTGRRTGRRRATVLSALQLDDGRTMVSGGALGQTRVPDWVANLRAEPAARLVGPEGVRPVWAHEPIGPDYERWRALAHLTWPRSSRYEERSGRALPVFLLSPAE